MHASQLRRAARAVAGLSLAALLTGVSQSQEPAQAPERPSTSPPLEDAGAAAEPRATAESAPDAAVLDLSLEDALALAIDNNVDYEISEVQSEVARFSALGSWGVFDWVFDAQVSIVDREFASAPQPPAFNSQSITDSDPEVAYAFDLTKPLTTGGRFNFHFDSELGADSTTLVPGDPDLGTSDVVFDTPGFTTDIVSVSYVQPLRRGAWSSYATSAQRETEVRFRQQVELQRAKRQEILLAVHDAYWELVSAIEQREVSDGALQLGLEQLDQNQRRLEAGVGTEVDVLQARAEVATRVEALLQMENQVAQAMDALKLLLFSEQEEQLWETEIVPTTPLPAVSTEGTPGWQAALGVALEMRSELRQQQFEIDVARLVHGRAISERLSGLDLSLSAVGRGVAANDGDAFEDAVSYEFPILSATLNYNMFIGNRSADFFERASRAEVRAAILRYEGLQTSIISEVRTAVREIFYQAEAVEAAEQSVQLAERQLAAEQARYEADLSTTFQVLEFQQSLIEARSNERRARVEFAKALASLSAAQGIIGQGSQS